MEPDVVHMYSSSPPPLDDTADDDDDEFGDFGGFSGVTSSVSFTEFDTPTSFSQSHATDTSPPSHFSNGSAGFPELSQGAPDSSATKGPDADLWDSRRAECSTCDCNGDAREALTNGYAALDADGAPSSPSAVDFKKRGGSSRPRRDSSPPRPEDRGAHFSTPPLCDTPVNLCRASNAREHTVRHIPQSSSDENGAGDTDGTGSASSEGLSNGEAGSCTGEGSEHGGTDPSTAQQSPCPTRTEDAAAHNGMEHVEGDQAGGWGDGNLSPAFREGEAGEEGRARENQEEGDQSAIAPGDISRSVSEDFASFCQAVSPDELEDFGDFSTTGFAPSPSSPAAASPTDHPKDDVDLRDSQSGPPDGFANFAAGNSRESVDEAEFGDFDASASCDGEREVGDSQGDFAAFPASDSFADFSSAPVGADSDTDRGWNAFGEQGEGPDGGHSWASFTQEQSSIRLDESGERWKSCTVGTAPPAGSPQTCRRDSPSVSLAGRLERLFWVSFPEAVVREAVEEVLSLRALLEPLDGQREPRPDQSTATHREPREVWWRLQDVDDAFGLRYQWGGSHSNKTLLCSLGIDTRNILFTGQKKQPMVVPMFAAGLGMLEPTREHLKPTSAAEKITSIAQVPPVSPEMSTSPDSAQEALPPVQFDWSSSGLTNPLDASGGSTLLNLDFFGPVEDCSSSSSTSIPGVDLELYELTRAKLESGTSSPAADAIARLMSNAEKTSVSARRPRKEEILSEEASKVIMGLPDLSFMQAKVLMFPTTLTPLCSSAPV